MAVMLKPTLRVFAFFLPLTLSLEQQVVKQLPCLPPNAIEGGDYHILNEGKLIIYYCFDVTGHRVTKLYASICQNGHWIQPVIESCITQPKLSRFRRSPNTGKFEALKRQEKVQRKITQGLLETRIESNTPTILRVHPGSRAFLLCRVENLGTHSVIWNFQEKVLSIDTSMISSDKRFIPSHDDATGTWLMEIRRVRLLDAGNYTCQVSSKPPLKHIVSLQVIPRGTPLLPPENKPRQKKNTNWPTGIDELKINISTLWKEMSQLKELVHAHIDGNTNLVSQMLHGEQHQGESGHEHHVDAPHYDGHHDNEHHHHHDEHHLDSYSHQNNLGERHHNESHHHHEGNDTHGDHQHHHEEGHHHHHSHKTDYHHEENDTHTDHHHQHDNEDDHHHSDDNENHHGGTDMHENHGNQQYQPSNTDHNNEEDGDDHHGNSHNHDSGGESGEVSGEVKDKKHHHKEQGKSHGHGKCKMCQKMSSLKHKKDGHGSHGQDSQQHHHHHHHHHHHQHDNQMLKAHCHLLSNVEFRNPNITGHVTISQKSDGKGPVYLDISIKGVQLPQDGSETSLHGFHIHESAVTESKCSSAGPHFNPGGVTHGGPNSPIRHVGDLGNIKLTNGGVEHYIITDTVVKFFGSNSIIGKSIVLHELVDDLGQGGNEGSSTTGNAGGRMACCNIEGENLPARGVQPTMIRFNG